MGEIQIMCNWSESIKESIEKSTEERSIRRERLNAVERMIKANITKEQIISMVYTEDEYAKAETSVFVNS